MAHRDVIVIGASAGGIEAVSEAVAGLPRDLEAAVCVVIHIPPYSASELPKILGAAGPLPAAHPQDGEELRHGRIYVAPPDLHMLLDEGRVLVRHGPKENRFRPSVDALFRSAAYVHGPRVIGVVMSGVLDDGTSGLWSIKRLGGLAIAQDPEDAMHSEMPRSAIEEVRVDHVCRADQLGPLLARLTSETIAEREPVTESELRRLGLEIDIAARSGAFDKGIMNWGDIAPFTCPDCHGALVRFDEGTLLRFRCHAGHGFTPRALLAGITDSNENTLWQAVRGLEEQSALLEYLAGHFGDAGRPETAALFATNARQSRARAEAIHEALPAQQQLGHDVRNRKP